jgi:glutamyl-tRNA(Gln) amidotransferase subunit E
VGVPSDTRQALRGGTNGFERVLPGAERMYPDTDLPPLEIAPERRDRIRDALPERVWDRIARYREMGLPEDVLAPLCASPRAPVFEEAVSSHGADPVFASVVLVQRAKALRRDGLDPDAVPDEALLGLLAAQAKGALSRHGVVARLERLASVAVGRMEQPSPIGRDAPGVLDGLPGPIGDGDIRTTIEDCAHAASALRFKDEAPRRRYLMGRVMALVGEGAEGARVAGLLEEVLDAAEATP